MKWETDYPPVKCPIFDKMIENVVCFDICLVAEGTSPDNELPVGVLKTKELVETCMNCPNHMD